MENNWLNKELPPDADPYKQHLMKDYPLLDMKYFTPSIGDIKIGYECELWSSFPPKAFHWNKNIITPFTMKLALDRINELDKYIRVPYLTKEQIEAEGWKYNTEEPYKIYKYDNYMRDGWKFNYSPEYKALILTSYNFKELSYSPCFRGQCKDINTFRYICKLLNIK